MKIRTKLIINKQLQLSFLLIFLIFGLLFLSIYMGYVSYILRNIPLAKLDEESASYLTEFIQTGAWMGLLLGIVVFSITLFFSLYFSNKIAGPIYNICRQLRNARETGVYTPVKIRDGDYFEDLVEEINGLLDSKKH